MVLEKCIQPNIYVLIIFQEHELNYLDIRGNLNRLILFYNVGKKLF